MLHGISNGNGYSLFGNSKINGKLSLLFNSDLNDENNNLVNDNKLTRETFIWHNFENPIGISVGLVTLTIELLFMAPLRKSILKHITLIALKVKQTQ